MRGHQALSAKPTAKTPGMPGRTNCTRPADITGTSGLELPSYEICRRKAKEENKGRWYRAKEIKERSTFAFNLRTRQEPTTCGSFMQGATRS